MRFSNFCRIYEVCDSKNNFYYLLRYSLLNYSFLFSLKEFEILLDDLKIGKNSKEVKELNEKHLIVQDNYKEVKFVDYLIKSRGVNKAYFDIFYLIFDTHCNLNCKYCYTEGSVQSGFKHQKMNKLKLEKTFIFLERFILEGLKKKFVNNKIAFIFYGSEPLMYPDLFKCSLKKIDKLSKKLNFIPEKQIITNGTLITNSIADLLKKEEVSVSVSLDGKKEINDQMRIFPNKMGSFDKILEGINKFKNKKVPFSISCTLGSHNINFLNENLEFFKQIGARGVGFNLPLEAKFKEIPFLSILKANKKLFGSFDYATKCNFFESRVGRKLKAFNDFGKIHFRDCGAYGNQLVFFPNGDIGICQGYLGYRKNLVGNINSSTAQEIIESPILRKWSLRSPINRSECLNCPALGICGGGCIFNSECNYGDILHRNKAFCIHTLMSLDWLINKSIKKKLNDENVYVQNMTFLFR